MSDYWGVIIEESLADKGILRRVHIQSTDIEPVTEHHSTPWLSRWTLHSVIVPVDSAAQVAQEISASFDADHAGSWYADFKNETQHYVVFPGRVFAIDRNSQTQYDAARDHGISIGIPPHQVDFHPSVEEWER